MMIRVFVVVEESVESTWMDGSVGVWDRDAVKCSRQYPNCLMSMRTLVWVGFQLVLLHCDPVRDAVYFPVCTRTL